MARSVTAATAVDFILRIYSHQEEAASDLDKQECSKEESLKCEKSPSKKD